MLQKLLEAHKLEPISIAKPDDWVEFDEYERIQLPTVQSTISYAKITPGLADIFFHIFAVHFSSLSQGR